MEDALFREVLAGRLPNDGVVPEFETVPLWDDSERGALSSLELTLNKTPVGRYEREVFAPQARALICGLLSEGQLHQDDRVRWLNSSLSASGPSATTSEAF